VTTLLASFPSPPQGVWHLGWLPIRAYALFIIIGIVVALIIGDRRWVARGGEPGVIYDIALWAVPFGLIGGRLYHVMTDWETYFGDDGAGFVAALKIWDGGLGIWGAVALGGVGAWIGCRRRGIPLPAFGDAIAPGIILAQAIGRLGNYFNQELYGRTTTMPWGLKIYDRRDPSGLIDPHSLDGVSTGHVVAVVQPTFLYELLWNVLVFVALIYIDRWFKLGHGRLFATYVAGYCVGRFWVELLRDDHATHIAGIRINSFTSTFVFIAAVVYIMLAPKGREDPASLAGKPHKPPAPEPKKAAEVKQPKAPVKAEDSALMEWTKELAAVASTSGVVAGVAVAAEHDEDDTSGGEAVSESEPQEAEEGHAEDLTPDVEPEDEDDEEQGVAEAAEDESATDEAPEASTDEETPEGSDDEADELPLPPTEHSDEDAAKEAEPEAAVTAETRSEVVSDADEGEQPDESADETKADEGPDDSAHEDGTESSVANAEPEVANVEAEAPEAVAPAEGAELADAEAAESADESDEPVTPESVSGGNAPDTVTEPAAEGDEAPSEASPEEMVDESDAEAKELAEPETVESPTESGESEAADDDAYTAEAPEVSAAEGVTEDSVNHEDSAEQDVEEAAPPSQGATEKVTDGTETPLPDDVEASEVGEAEPSDEPGTDRPIDDDDQSLKPPAPQEDSAELVKTSRPTHTPPLRRRLLSRFRRGAN